LERVDHLRYQRDHDARDHEVRGESIILADTVARYYEAQTFQPKWRDPARLDLLVAALADIYNDGLDPADYHVEALQSFRTDLRAAKTLPPAEQADLELLATDAMMLALYHLYLGKVDPVQLSSQWNFSTRPVSVERGFERLTQALDSGQIRETFDRARPQHVWYQRGRERLKDYRAIAAAGGWSPISDGPTLKLGMSDPRVPTLRLRLQTTGDFITNTPDQYPSSTVYDAELEAAVKRFQERHGLTADGAIGPATRVALNVSVAARIDQIRINLERARWVMHELQGDFVLVNVAGFDVSYFRDNEPIWTSKVIVGRPYRETPIFKSLITYVVFNPTWTIPPTIGEGQAPDHQARSRLPEAQQHPRDRLERPRGGPVLGELEPLQRVPPSTVSTAAGPGRRQCARAREDHVPEPAHGLSARHADEVAVRPGPAYVQLGLYPRGESVRAGGAGTQRFRALDPGNHGGSGRVEEDADREPAEPGAGLAALLDGPASPGRPGNLPQRHLRPRPADACRVEQRFPPAMKKEADDCRGSTSPANFTQEENRWATASP
jgi:hypothetical protein